MRVLAIWFLLSALAVLAGLIWAFAPVLVPFIGITVGLGGLVAVIVSLARRLEQHVARRRGNAANRPE